MDALCLHFALLRPLEQLPFNQMKHELKYSSGKKAREQQNRARTKCVHSGSAEFSVLPGFSQSAVNIKIYIPGLTPSHLSSQRSELSAPLPVHMHNCGLSKAILAPHL